MMFKDQDGGDQHPNIINYCYTLYHIEFFERVQLYKVRVKDNSKRILEHSEWDKFLDFWKIEHDAGVKRSVMEIFVEGSDAVWVGKSRTNQINIEVAQKACSVSIYRLIHISSPSCSIFM